jgi:hypothetical protein
LNYLTVKASNFVSPGNFNSSFKKACEHQTYHTENIEWKFEKRFRTAILVPFAMDFVKKQICKIFMRWKVKGLCGSSFETWYSPFTNTWQGEKSIYICNPWFSDESTNQRRIFELAEPPNFQEKKTSRDRERHQVDYGRTL